MIQPTFPSPSLEIIPMHGAVAARRSTTLDILIRVVPPRVELCQDRPPLNLSLVIDGSGSMAGDNIKYAKEAAKFAIANLLPSDRVSVVLFDTHVNTLVPSTLATDKQALLAKVGQISVGSSTALHQGWVEGGVQVSQYLQTDHLNRVILLSDGLANVGETRPDVIASDVHGLSQRGVSTTTLGVGHHYSEDLLEAMARSGDGNFYHIESAEQIPALFESELQGLSATLGQKVSLGLKAQNGAVVKDVLNDFDLTETGRHKLPNLLLDTPINVVVRLQIPALETATDLCEVRLAWDDPDQATRQVITATLRLPVVTVEQLSDFPAVPEVEAQVALLMAARARQEAMDNADRGDMAQAMNSLQSAQMMFSAMAPCPQFDQEMEALAELQQDYSAGNLAQARKKSKSERYNLQRSRPSKRPEKQD